MVRTALLILFIATAVPAAELAAPSPDLEEQAKHVKAHPEDRAALKEYLLTAVNELKGKINRGDADGAIELATRIDDVKPGLITVLYARGRAHALKKSLDLALSDYRAARLAADQAGKARPEIDIAIGITCRAQSDFEGALGALKDYKEHGGKIDADWYLVSLECLERSAQVERLLEMVKEAYERFPAHPQVQQWHEKYARSLKAAEKEAGMSQGGTLHFAIKFQDTPEDSAAKERVQKALEYAYDKVTRDMGHVPASVVNVIIYSDRKDYEAAGEVAHWVGAHYDPQDSSIRVGLMNSRMSEAEFTGFLVHEFTHLVLDEITQHRIPSWLTEGLAQIEQDRDMSSTDQKLRALLKRPASLPPIGSLEREITGGGSVDPGTGYAIAWSFTKYLQDQWGTSSMGGVLTKLGQKYTFEEAAASDYPSLMQKWIEAEKSRLNVP